MPVLLAGAGISLFLIVGLAFLLKSQEKAETVTLPVGRPATAHAQGEIARPLPSGARQGELADPSAEQLLSEFWGTRWETLRPALIEQGVDLSAGHKVLPWAEAKPKINAEFARSLVSHLGGMREACLQWPDKELTSLWLVECFKLQTAPTDYDVAQIDMLCVEGNYHLTQLTDEYLTGVDTAVNRALAEEKYKKYPIVSPPEDSISSNLFAGACAFGGWAVTLLLPTAEYQDLANLRSQIDAARIERNKLIRQYLKGK